jgi:hypothetical protein
MRETKHVILFEYQKVELAEDYPRERDAPECDYIDFYTYQTLECCGCGDVSFRLRYCFGQRVQHDDDLFDEDLFDDTYYPPRVWRKKPVWISKLPDELRSLLDEVYTALQAGSRTLATMGARSVLDMVILERVGDRGSFKRKLEAMVAEGWVGLHDKDILYAALNAGNAAIHRGHIPTDSELTTVMNIVEHMLNSIYILPDDANRLRQNTPQRGMRHNE